MMNSGHGEVLSEEDQQGLRDLSELNLDMGMGSFLKEMGISRDAFRNALHVSKAPQSSVNVLELRLISNQPLSSLSQDFRIDLIRVLRICNGVTEHDFTGSQLPEMPSPAEDLAALNKRLEEFKAQSGILNQVVDPEILEKLDFE